MQTQTGNDEARTALAGILECTRRVQALIEAGDWLGAAQLDAERQRRLQECCARIEPSTCPPDLIAALSDMVKLNDAMIGAVEHRQRGIQRDAETVTVGRKAVAAYSLT